jgi:hypothetical protein
LPATLKNPTQPYTKTNPTPKAEGEMEQTKVVRLVKTDYRTGPDGLLAAVIETAIRDATRGNVKPAVKDSAIAYLNGRGGTIFTHLDLLHWQL